jgi:hypothetical protein
MSEKIQRQHLWRSGDAVRAPVSAYQVLEASGNGSRIPKLVRALSVRRGRSRVGARRHSPGPSEIGERVVTEHYSRAAVTWPSKASLRREARPVSPSLLRPVDSL